MYLTALPKSNFIPPVDFQQNINTVKLNLHQIAWYKSPQQSFEVPFIHFNRHLDLAFYLYTNKLIVNIKIFRTHRSNLAPHYFLAINNLIRLWQVLFFLRISFTAVLNNSRFKLKIYQWSTQYQIPTSNVLCKLNLRHL